jgi:hypothetical protein
MGLLQLKENQYVITILIHEFWLQTILQHTGQEWRSTCTSKIHDLQQTEL